MTDQEVTQMASEAAERNADILEFMEYIARQGWRPDWDGDPGSEIKWRQHLPGPTYSGQDVRFMFRVWQTTNILERMIIESLSKTQSNEDNSNPPGAN